MEGEPSTSTPLDRSPPDDTNEPHAAANDPNIVYRLDEVGTSCDREDNNADTRGSSGLDDDGTNRHLFPFHEKTAPQGRSVMCTRWRQAKIRVGVEWKTRCKSHLVVKGAKTRRKVEKGERRTTARVVCRIVDGCKSARERFTFKVKRIEVEVATGQVPYQHRME